jgi:hypothetical protein
MKQTAGVHRLFALSLSDLVAQFETDVVWAVVIGDPAISAW